MLQALLQIYFFPEKDDSPPLNVRLVEQSIPNKRSKNLTCLISS